MRILWLIGALIFCLQNSAQARVYRYVRVGSFATSFHLADYKGQTFLKTMKDVMYPALMAEAVPRFEGSPISGVKIGEGVELRLTDRVSTYHVKFAAHWEENAERSGRSFAGVDSKPWNDKTEYVADASYKHFLSTLEDLLDDPDQIEVFYRAILQVLLNSDPSGIGELSTKGQQVAADFVAVYVAEQYRHLISGKGKKLGRRHNWDNAHLQVTLLAAFHAGQKHKAMYYKGRFLNKVYHQQSKETCIYQKPWGEIPDYHWSRSVRLIDYWQFNEECERSGVNITRRDFQKLGRATTHYLIENDNDLSVRAFNKTFQQKWTRNFIESMTNSIISNWAPDTNDRWQAQIDVALKWILASHRQANAITLWLNPQPLN